MKSTRLIALGLLFILTGCATKDSVRMREESMIIPTWEIGPVEANPTFAWSSPRRPVYPYPYKEILTNEKGEKTYTACWLENEFIQVLVLPEIGGRLHGAKDKTNDYNFFYWQPTIKPALIGMTGAWISGGIEWNFPYGHRPTGFSPVSYNLVENEDGSHTVWVGETEWVNRMRWVIGLTVYPGRSIIEAKVRLMNPAPLHHSYYMWATTAVNANENYQAIYPTRLMTEHGKFEFFRWPIHEGVDISWWKNIPNASSFFAVERGDFFGGYDHGKQAGTILTGDKHIIIGKKLWTWGTSPFGRIWESILTEGQGPYLEPQAGAFADNQPDNHWLESGEVKAFSFFFYPVRDIGAYKKANINGALNLEFDEDRISIGVYSTAIVKPGIIRLTRGGDVILEEKLNIDPSRPFIRQLDVEGASDSREDFRLCLLDAESNELVSYSPEILEELPIPEPAPVYGPPQTIASVDELWQIGDFKSKYKYQDLRAGFDDYFKEALRQDPGHAPSHISLAEWDLKRADYRSALRHLDAAGQRSPDNGTVFYMKAVAQEALGNYDAAYDLYYRSVHYQQYLSQAYQCITRLDLRRGDFEQASQHVCKAIQSNTLNPQLWALKATVLRFNVESEQAQAAAERALTLDPVNFYAMNELYLAMKAQGKSGRAQKKKLAQILLDDPHYYIELALHYLNAGLHEDAAEVLERIEGDKQSRSALTGYYSAYCQDGLGDRKAAARLYKEAARRPVDYCFPFRLEAINVFRAAFVANPGDARAHYFLGLVYGGLGEVDSAMVHWQQAVRLEPGNARAWRNLGLAHLNVSGDLQAAMQCYEQAFKLLPKDSRILLELDKVRQARKESTAERLSFLRQHQKVVESRDDLLTSMLDLMVREGEYEEALEHYLSHHFHNWEGGYSIHNAYMEANIGMAQRARTPHEALECYLRACEYPPNLEFAPREPNLRGFLYYPMAQLYRQLNDEHKADSLLTIAAGESTAKPTLASYYQALALRELGKSKEADRILEALQKEGQQLIEGQSVGYERQTEEYRKALGYYYLAKVHSASARQQAAREALQIAAELSPLIEREALIFAQIAFAGAHQ
ncbi:MAG: DUF5107 domain-containing protein [Candidatus Neomarinimicrobiota bacterium]